MTEAEIAELLELADSLSGWPGASGKPGAVVARVEERLHGTDGPYGQTEEGDPLIQVGLALHAKPSGSGVNFGVSSHAHSDEAVGKASVQTAVSSHSSSVNGKTKTLTDLDVTVDVDRKGDKDDPFDFVICFGKDDLGDGKEREASGKGGTDAPDLVIDLGLFGYPLKAVLKNKSDADLERVPCPSDKGGGREGLAGTIKGDARAVEFLLVSEKTDSPVAALTLNIDLDPGGSWF